MFSKEYYLWILDTTENSLAIKNLNVEFSSFPLYKGYSAEDYFECYFDTVIEHHPK